ncbi:MAG: sigma-54-dependent Fis family transcriptional regulator [Planctomycetota bacterium]
MPPATSPTDLPTAEVIEALVAAARESGSDGLASFCAELLIVPSVAGVADFLASPSGWLLNRETGDVLADSSTMDWIAEVADRKPFSRGPFHIRKTDAGGAIAVSDGSRILAVFGDSPLVGSPFQAFITSAIETALRISRRDEIESILSDRVGHLEAVLKWASQWQTIDDDQKLLEAISEAATESLICERASIFLWNRRRGKLVAKTAIGVDQSVQTFEVDDDAGVVGEVLATGEAQIWNSKDDDPARINRRVDEQLSFETRSLVAVPMRDSRGKLVGVFEVINAIDHDFRNIDAQKLSDLAMHAAVAIGGQQTRRKLVNQRDRLIDDAASASPLIGKSEPVELIRSQITRIANTDLSVLILGENGTGKEVIAKSIHYQSERRAGPFIAVNCAALVETILESELFGHEQGAFTDASQTRAGQFEAATGGTLLLDEIGDMSLSGQAKLLRVLEEKVVVRVGGSRPIPVDVRVLAATNQPLERLIAEKRFRQDLYFRLNVVALNLPPLHERGDDVILLAEHFLRQFATQSGRPDLELGKDARDALLGHTWPGNVRELRNTIERVCYLSQTDIISKDDLTLSDRQRASAEPESSHALQVIDEPLGEATRLFQISHIQQAIDANDGNMTAAAKQLGLHRSNLYRKMGQLGMETSE